jgi:hypothetical protein
VLSSAPNPKSNQILGEEITAHQAKNPPTTESKKPLPLMFVNPRNSPSDEANDIKLNIIANGMNRMPIVNMPSMPKRIAKEPESTPPLPRARQTTSLAILFVLNRKTKAGCG